jgi:hypothetical protein
VYKLRPFPAIMFMLGEMYLDDPAGDCRFA